MPATGYSATALLQKLGIKPLTKLLRDYALVNSLVDVKVCAVSNIWSGLKLVVPLTLR